VTDDPIKLYVVVMSILLCVLAFVAYASWNQADELETALEIAPRQAKQLRKQGGEVQALCEQLQKSGVGKGFISSIQKAARVSGIPNAPITEDKSPKRIGPRGRERRFKVEIQRGKTGPLTREQVARFCRAVERDSRNILRTIEIELRRHTGKGGFAAGDRAEVVGDAYTGKIVFGLRVINE
jgi:hypothetical protein